MTDEAPDKHAHDAPGTPDSPATDREAIREQAIAAIKTCYDPEIPVNIYELGLIYDVLVNDNGDVKISMTLTSPHCPVAESLPKDVESRVSRSGRCGLGHRRNHLGPAVDARDDVRGGAPGTEPLIICTTENNRNENQGVANVSPRDR